MALPNGPGELLTTGQQSLLGQAMGKVPKLFRANDSRSPSEQLANEQLKDYKVKSKLKPTASDVAKLSGINSLGFLYLGDTIAKALGAKTTGGAAKLEGSFLENMLGGKGSLLSSILTPAKGSSSLLAKKFGPKAMGFLTSAAGPVAVGVGAIAALAGSVFMTAMDVSKGSKKAKEWGVSKFTAGLAAGLGGTSKGIKGMTHGAIKGALGGAGIGGLGALIGTFVFPGVGTAVGGLIGAGIGAVVGAVTGGALGHRGGERIAKDFAKADAWIKNKVFAPIGELGKSIFTTASSGITKALNILAPPEKLAKLWAPGTPMSRKLLGTVAILGGGIADFTSKAATGISNFLSDLTTKDDGSRTALGRAFDGIKEAALAVPEFLRGGLNTLGNFILGEERWESLKNFFDEKVFGGIKTFFDGVGSWIKKLFGLQEKSEEDVERAEWEKKFKRTEEYRAIDNQRANATLEGSYFDMAAAMEAAWAKEKASREKTGVKDAIFSLEKALGKGSLFQAGTSGVSLDGQDDLYLMASTNPARDALVSSVDKLNGLIAELASVIAAYRPQTNNSTAMIQNSTIPLRDLVALPSRA